MVMYDLVWNGGGDGWCVVQIGDVKRLKVRGMALVRNAGKIRRAMSKRMEGDGFKNNGGRGGNLSSN